MAKDNWRNQLSDYKIEVDKNHEGPDVYVNYMKQKSAPERIGNEMLRDKELTDGLLDVAQGLFESFFGGRK